MRIKEEEKQKYFKRVYDNINQNGFHVTALLEENGFTPYAYSTGVFENFKIPELFISGLGPNLSMELVKNYVEKYKFRSVPLNEKVTDITDRFPVFFIKVKNENLSEYVLTSIRHYENRPYEYLQLIFPDLDGKFPNEIGYNYDQEIIGKLE
jgi:hypothetical protein